MKKPNDVKTRRSSIMMQVTMQNTALDLAKKLGYHNVTRFLLHKHAEVSPSVVNQHYPSNRDLELEILNAAVRRKMLDIIAQAIVMKDPAIKKITTELWNASLDKFRR